MNNITKFTPLHLLPENESQKFNDFESVTERNKGNKNENVTFVTPELKFPVMSFDDLIATEYKPNWLVKGLIEKENLGLIFGSPASGKSLLVQDMAFCIAAGLPFHGKETTQGNVLYIAGEGFSGLKKRFMALSQEYGYLAKGLYFSKQPAALMDKQNALDVAEAVKAIGNVSLIVIDTLHRNMGAGDENSSRDWGEFQNNIDNYLRPLGAAVLIVHHSGHNETGRSRGSSSIRGSMDVEFSVTKNGDNVIMTNTKMKDFEQPKPMAFNVKQVQIDDDYSSVVLESTEYIARQNQAKRMSSNDQKVLEALRKVTVTNSVTPPVTVKELFKDSPENIPRAVVTLGQWRELAYSVMTINNDSNDPKKIQAVKKSTFWRCKNNLEEGGFIGIDTDFVWLVDKSVT
jgi:hypothetical protein